MLITKAIEAADALCPNDYTLDEKLRWCSEVNLALRRGVKKLYDMIETVITSPDDIELPDDIPPDRIECVYIGGRLITRVDFRSLPYLSGDVFTERFGITFTSPQKMKVIYLTTPAELCDIIIKGSFNVSENKIEADELPLYEGDNIICEVLDSLSDEPSFSDPLDTYVLENDGRAVLLTDDIFTPGSGVNLAIRRVIDDETEAEAPYDRMYIEYLLAKAALYQHDYEAYSAHMLQYNSIFDEYKRDYKQRNPLNDLAVFKNIW